MCLLSHTLSEKCHIHLLFLKNTEKEKNVQKSWVPLNILIFTSKFFRLCLFASGLNQARHPSWRCEFAAWKLLLRLYFESEIHFLHLLLSILYILFCLSQYKDKSVCWINLLNSILTILGPNFSKFLSHREALETHHTLQDV